MPDCFFFGNGRCMFCPGSGTKRAFVSLIVFIPLDMFRLEARKNRQLRLQEVNTTRTPVEVVNFFGNVTNSDVMRSLVAKRCNVLISELTTVSTIQDMR